MSYSRHDAAIVEGIAARLKSEGLEPFLDRWSLTAGEEWQRELGEGLYSSRCCAVFVGPNDLGPWELQEAAVALARAATQREFRVFPVLLPGAEEPFDPNRLPHFLRTRTWVDFRRSHGDERAMRDLINAVKGVPFGPHVPAERSGDVDVVPYRGLRVFEEKDAPFFFGRDGEIQRLREKLKSSNFLAVLGPSGSGKSSLVLAGLVPALRAHALARGDRWDVVVLRPGAAPLTALAAHLAKLVPSQAMQATLAALAGDERTLHLSVELALVDRARGDRVLVVVDQLEEVFTLCRDESERCQLLSTLLYAASAPGARTTVLVTMRSDFYGRCAAYPEFAQLITAQQALVGPMDAAGLRQAIEEPARAVGLELEQGLPETILADVGTEPGALPLLEHALLELWERRRGRTLTLDGYRQAGGVQGALAQRAEAIFDELTPAQQKIARRVLLRLTQPGEGTEDTRRRAKLTELGPAVRGEDFEEVFSRLVDSRMLTTARDETGDEVVDVSHEALIRGWPRLRRWIDGDRAGLIIHRRLTDAAREWETLSEEPAALYRGARLAAASDWAPDHAEDLSELEGAFLEASQVSERSELTTAKRRARRSRVLASVLAALTSIVAALAVWALRERSDAVRQSAKATSTALSLAAASPLLLASRSDVSLLLALEAYRANPSVQARRSVVAALTPIRQSGVTAILHGHTGHVNSVAFSRDGSLASGSDDGTIRFWDVGTHTQRDLLHSSSPSVSSVAFSPDGDTLAAGSGYGTVELWNADTHSQLGPLVTQGGATSVAFSPDGLTLAAGDGLAGVSLWELKHYTSLFQLPGSLAVSSLAFSPVGSTLAVSSDSGSNRNGVQLWNVHTDPYIKLGPRLNGDPSASVAFSRDGGTLAVVSQSDGIHLWDVHTYKQRAKPLNDTSDPVAGVAVTTDEITSVAFSPDGRWLAAGTSDNTVNLWNAHTYKKLTRQLTSPSPNPNLVIGVTSVAFSPDGRWLAAGSSDDTIRLWDVHAASPLTGDTAAVRSVSWRNLTDLQTQVCSLVGTGLSETEWRLYASGIAYRQSCP